MKKTLIFGLFFVLGVATLVGGALLANDILRKKDIPVDTAYIEASSVEPASGIVAAVSEVPPEEAGDLMPATTPEDGSPVADVETTHPILRLTPDKTEMVTLDREAQSIVIGNPANASVMMENPKLLLIVPRSPGATHMSVLDKEGEIIMQRHIVVAAPREKYVRIRRSCANATGRNAGCQPVSVYYCPDMCHEVSTDGNTGNTRR